MNEFLKKIAAILEVEQVNDADVLKSFPQWDSLSVLSVIAFVDADYAVNLQAADFIKISTAGELWKLVQSKKAA